MLKAKGLPGYFWGVAVSTAVHILNHAPTRALDGKTPYEAWHGKVPIVHYFRKFGYIVHLKIMRPNLKKLDDRSRKAIFVGYEGGSKAYRCYDPIDQRIIISRDVVFDEAGQWCWENADGDEAGDPEPFTMEYNTKIVRDVVPASASNSTSGFTAYGGARGAKGGMNKTSTKRISMRTTMMPRFGSTPSMT
jgi:hypothetical protein